MKAREIHSAPSAHPARLQLPPPPRRRPSVWRDKESGIDPEALESIVRLVESVRKDTEAILKRDTILQELSLQLAFTASKMAKEYLSIHPSNPELAASLATITAELEKLTCPTNPST